MSLEAYVGADALAKALRKPEFAMGRRGSRHKK
jgi:hypothetical protein